MIRESTPIVHDPLAVSLRVDVPRQTLEMVRNGETLATYPVSTSKFGLGTEPGSFRTPTGRFAVCEKIGHGAPEGAVFRSRLPTGEIAAPGGEEDLILTRILWLEGLDDDNRGTRDRYIYIHGTNQESLIGQPASHGCIRMKNADIVRLFEEVPTDASVEILT